MTSSSTTRHPRSTRRRGEAKIELVFFLPLLMALFSIVFLAASLTLSHSYASIGARNKAFRGRHEPWKPSGDYDTSRLSVPGASYAGLILGPSPRQQADGGLLHAEETRDVGVRFGPLKELVKDVTMEHYVLGGSWDQQEIEFRTHARLTLTAKSAYFGIGIPLNAFGSLAGFGSGGGGGANAIATANQAINDARNQLSNSINDLNRQLNDIRNALNAERNKVPPDEERIKELEKRERDINKQIGDLKEAEKKMHVDLSPAAGTSGGGGNGGGGGGDKKLTDEDKRQLSLLNRERRRLEGLARLAALTGNTSEETRLIALADAVKLDMARIQGAEALKTEIAAIAARRTVQATAAALLKAIERRVPIARFVTAPILDGFGQLTEEFVKWHNRSGS